MLKTAKVVGLNSDTDAALALASSGKDWSLYVIISCSADDAFSRTRQVLSGAQDFFSSSDEPITQRMTSTLGFIKESLGDTGNLQVLVAATQEEEFEAAFYLLSQGDQLVTYLVRGTTCSDLGNMSEGQLVSGLLQQGDRVVMATKSLIGIFDNENRSINNFPIEALEDEVAARLPEAEPYPVAAVVIESAVETTAEAEKEVIPEIGLLENSDVPPETYPGLVGALKQAAYLVGKIIPHSRKGVMYVGVGFLVVVVAALLFAQRYKQNSEASAAFENRYKVASDEYNKAQSLKDQDVAAAVASLSLAKSAVADALKIKPQDPKAQDLKKRLDDGSGDILKIYQVDNLPLWLDLNLIKKGLVAKTLSLSRNNLLVLDTSQKVLVEVGLGSKSQQALAGQDKLGEAGLASLNGDIAFVYSDKGVVRIDTKSKQASLAVKKDAEWGNITDLYGFAGNIYLLDEGKGQIWKYLPVDAGFSDKREYFKEGVKVDLAGVRRMQIDSSVWVLKGSGEILKYTQGSPDFFSIGGLDKGIKDPKSFFVSGDTDNLYLLDSGNSRLVILDKKGVYKAQYKSDELASFSDLVVDEKGKKVYLLDGSKIFTMDLR